MGETSDLSRLTAPIDGLVTGGIALLALVVVVATWLRTRSIAPTVGVIVLAGFAMWAVNNVEFIQQRIIGPDLPEPSGVIEGAAGATLVAGDLAPAAGDAPGAGDLVAAAGDARGAGHA